MFQASTYQIRITAGQGVGNLLNLISRVTILSVQASKHQPTLQLPPQNLLGFGRTLIVFYVIFFKVDERQWSDRRCCACSSWLKEEEMLLVQIMTT